VDLERIESPEEVEEVRGMIERHARYTRSQQAFKILALWEQHVPRFVKVMPRDYKRILEALARVREAGLGGEEAVMAAFEANAGDVARIGGS
jgi:glutamate synthase domain-containing protein 3